VKLEPHVVSRPRRTDRNAWVMAGVLAALWIALAVMPATRAAFLTRGNLANLLVQNAYVMVVAVGMTMVIVIRGIDLSIGAGVALTGMVAALLQQRYGVSAPLAIGAALGCGALLGVWHGVWIARFGLPAFIVTLAGFKAFRGLALVMSDARGVTTSDDFAVLNDALPVTATWALVSVIVVGGIVLTFRDAARRKTHGLDPTPTRIVAVRIAGQIAIAAAILAIFGGRGLPVQVAVAGAVVLAGVFVTRRTRFGRHLFAIGGNPEAARLSGIDVARATIWVYVIVGVLTAVAGVLLAARVGSVTPGNQGELLELDAITAVVIGGTSLLGGRGSIVGTMLGVLVFGTIAQGMNLLLVDSNWQLIFTGSILLIAVLIDVVLKGRRS
jgi:D-xylose transport system permease protein